MTTFKNSISFNFHFTLVLVWCCTTLPHYPNSTESMTRNQNQIDHIVLCICRGRRASDKTKPIMTLLLRQCAPDHLTRTVEDDMMIVLDSNTQQILHYKKVTPETAKVPLPLVSTKVGFAITGTILIRGPITFVLPFNFLACLSAYSTDPTTVHI